MNWFDCLFTFIEVAKRKSFANTARHLNLPAAVVTKRIQWLEKQLECDLLIRTTRRVTLTEEGDDILQQSAPIITAWVETKSQFKERKNTLFGTITIGFAPDLCALPLFMNCLQRFSHLHPQINLKTKTVKPSTCLIEEGLDLMIATDSYVKDEKTTKRIPLFSYHYGCYASRAYIEKFNCPLTPEDLKHHRCLTYLNHDEWKINNVNYIISSQHAFDSGNSLLAACKAGMGIIHFPQFMLGIAPESENLIELFSRPEESNQLCIYSTRRDYEPRKVRRLINIIKSSI